MDLLTILVGGGTAVAFALGLASDDTFPPRLRRTMQLVALLAAAIAALRFAATVVGWLLPGSSVTVVDFAIFYEAGTAARTQADLYDLAGIRQDPGVIAVYRHAPIGASLLALLTFLPFHAALDLWRLLNVALYLTLLGLIVRYFRLAPRAPLTLGIATLWLSSAPAREALAGGQWDTIFLAAATAALILLGRNRDSLAGAALALPIVLKFYPALLLMSPLIERRLRPLVGALVAGALLTLAALPVAGFANTRTFFTQVLPVVGGGTLYDENQTLYALVGRLLASEVSNKGVDARYPAELTAVIAGGLGLLVLVVSAITIRRSTGRELASELRFALTMAVSLLILPTAWVHYQAWTVLPLTVLAVAVARGRGTPAIQGCFAVAAALLVVGTERAVRGLDLSGGPAGLIISYKVFGLIALWAGLLLVIRRAPDQANVTDVAGQPARHVARR